MKKLSNICQLIIAFLLFSTNAFSKEYYVSVKGKDTNDGSISKPFATIQKAASIMVAGDICYIHGGIYHETVSLKSSGRKGLPIQFKCYKDEVVIMDGTKTIKSNWEVYKNGIYKTKVNTEKIDQLFADTVMMTEARWPNCPLYQIFERSNWAGVKKGSEHGKIISNAIAATGIDWTGAMAYLNVAHQWWTWNRKITKHKAGSNELKYDADLVGLCSYTPDFMGKKELEEKWGDDYFYLFGKLEALDVATEWFFDSQAKELYFFPPDNKKPSEFYIKYKVLDYGFNVIDKEYIEIEGINFFATTFKFEKCNHIKVSNCNLKYPTYSRTITEYDAERKESIITKITGDYNLVDKISLSYANNMGMMVMGNYNKVNNSIIHDVNWSGTLIYPALQLSGSPYLGVNWFNTIQYPPTPVTIENNDVTSYGNIASYNTLFNCGNSLLVYQAANSIVEYNHVYDGGKAARDVSLIYGCWPFSRGSEVRYNWVHGCVTDGWDGVKGDGGMGIRADDQSRNNVFHHNVIWNIGGEGIVAKGEFNLIYNNTLFDIKGKSGKQKIYLLLEQNPEPVKIWAAQWPQLQKQNQWSKVFNNLTQNICGSHNLKDTIQDIGANIFNNYRKEEQTLPLVDKYHFDFRLKENSELIDKGKVFSNTKYYGKAPDIGAYEFGEKMWIPGATWKEDNKWLSLLKKVEPKNQ